MGLTKAQRQERSDFLAKLYEAGYNVSDAMRKYDEKFGTHYADKLPSTEWGKLK